MQRAFGRVVTVAAAMAIAAPVSAKTMLRRGGVELISVSAGTKVVTRPGSPIMLERGHLLLKTSGQSTRVLTPDGEITVRPDTVAEVRSDGNTTVRVGAVTGSIAWVARAKPGARVVIAEGHAWTSTGLAPAASTRTAWLMAFVDPAKVEPDTDAEPKVHVVSGETTKPTRRSKKQDALEAAAAEKGGFAVINVEPADEVDAGASALLNRGLRELHEEEDPEKALVTFDEYRDYFGDRPLPLSGVAARVDVLVALNRDADALEQLDAAALDAVDTVDGAVARGLRIQRAELRSKRRRCEGAITDFDPLVATKDAIGARALYGRAICHLRLGDRAPALLDFDAYLKQYPSGPKADEVAKRLKSKR